VDYQLWIVCLEIFVIHHNFCSIRPVDLIMYALREEACDMIIKSNLAHFNRHERGGKIQILQQIK